MLCHHAASVRLGEPMIYLYARVSTDRQENGKDAQLDRLAKWSAGKEIAGVYVDEDVSAHSVRFQDRPSGKKLWDLLEPGDIVVATKMDRMFRRLADMAQTIDQWKSLRIRLILLDMDVDIESPHGRAFAGWSAVSAQLESELHGQRKREVYAHKRKLGLPVNQTRPFGWVSFKGPDGKLAGYRPCQAERELGDMVVKLRKDGLSYARIAITFCDRQKPVRRKGSRGYYSVTDIYLLHRAALAGYPKLPRDVWQAPDYAQKLREATLGASPIST